MKRIRHHLITIMAFIFLGLPILTPSPAYAWNPFDGIDCSATNAVPSDTSSAPGGSAVCTDGKNTEDPISGRNGLIMKIVDIVALAAGIAAVILIILAGLRLVTAAGSSEDVAGARRTLIYAIVGIVVVILSRTLVVFILEKL